MGSAAFSAHYCPSTSRTKLRDADSAAHHCPLSIVGYANHNLSTSKYATVAPCFAGLGADGSFSLANVSATGYDWESDWLYVMNPDDSSADQTLMYLDSTTAASYSMAAGWYDFDTWEPFEEAVTIGTGFMTDFNSGTANLVYSGEVYTEPFSVDLRGSKYSILANALPRNVTMSEISATGYDWESDWLYIMNPDDSSADRTLMYLDATTAASYSMTAGWYDYDTWESVDDLELAPGEGFMTDFNSGNVIINFPAAM